MCVSGRWLSYGNSVASGGAAVAEVAKETTKATFVALAPSSLSNYSESALIVDGNCFFVSSDHVFKG